MRKRGTLCSVHIPDGSCTRIAVDNFPSSINQTVKPSSSPQDRRCQEDAKKMAVMRGGVLVC